MLQRNSNVRSLSSAKIIKGKVKRDFFKRDALEKFASQVDSMPYGEKREDAKMALECVLSGKKIVMEKGKIYLYFERSGYTRIEESYTITKNKELYTLLENLVQS